MTMATIESTSHRDQNSRLSQNADKQ